jgi:hypothetical protein
VNIAFANSPDYVFRRIAAGKKHPCANVVKTADGLVTVTFVHSRLEDGRCSRCHGIMPVTFWQFNPHIAAGVNAV